MANTSDVQDVAVKVLTVQDFHDDQLKEFLREVIIIMHPTWLAPLLAICIQ